MIKYIVDDGKTKIEFLDVVEATQHSSVVGVPVHVIDDQQYTAKKPKYYPDLTPRQLRQVLVLNGISMETVDLIINKMPSPARELAMIEWEYSVSIKWGNPLVVQMAGAIGISASQMQAMWEQGLSL